ncbi:T9SS type A sorting domain-containing protein [Chryseobacterium sp. SC28]|uniref:T9SS type A sorting domain-containing protein n=1 Tax=Chryseobacterium sp. SC28 TaxID=2268028 RepID=UPI0039774639
MKSVKVYDVTGKQILTKEINAAQSQIDFSRFSSGVYIVNTAMEDGTTTSTKVIKQ